MNASMDEALEIRAKCPYFRVLIIGRANAGKTTILQKVCNTTSEPEICTPMGEKVKYLVWSAMSGTQHRGLGNTFQVSLQTLNPTVDVCISSREDYGKC
jgi:GTPase SAR1 family protein